ncbi:MAG TPA: BsuPI-related putative proteinase inhibitor [Longimicrobium sp.]|jgi:hypothetical protein|nr:BsuPI-related putative proteinase inhibitor [Longimicrobium sp.]
MSHSVPRPGILLLLAALLVAGACTRPLPAPASGTLPPPAPPSLVSSLSVETEGDTVVLTLQVTNPYDAPVAVTFPSGQTYDFSVRDAGGRVLWTWSADRGFIQAVQTRTLAAGETWTFRERWTPPSGTRGALTAVARLASSSHAVEHTRTFTRP